MTEEEIRDLLVEMRHESVPPDSLARVRAGVAVRMQARSLRRLVLLFAIPALSLCFVGLYLRLQPELPDLPSVVARSASVPVAPVLIAEATRRIARGIRRVPAQAPVAPVSEIRIETDDPDVVILLLGGD